MNPPRQLRESREQLNAPTINASTGQIIDASDLGCTISTSNNPRLIICCEVQFLACQAGRSEEEDITPAFANSVSTKLPGVMIDRSERGALHKRARIVLFVGFQLLLPGLETPATTRTVP